MAQTVLPAINQNVAGDWSEQQRDLYNYLPFHMAEMQVKRRQHFVRWPKLCGKMTWTPNMGEILKGVRKDPSPVIRQQFFPAELSASARADSMDVREVTRTTTVKHHKYNSPIFQFYPSFRDFMKNHVDVHGKDIMEKMEIAEDLFVRSNVFHFSPNVYLPGAAGGEIQPCKSEAGSDVGLTGKSTAWLQANLPKIQTTGLMLQDLNQLMTIAETDIGMPPFAGAQNTANASATGLTERYILMTSSEAYNQFYFDPWLRTYRQIDLDITTAPFKGNLWGRMQCMLERFPMRMLVDGSFPAPETRVVGAPVGGSSASENIPYNVGETIPNPAYTSAPFEVAFLIGDFAYDLINVGPPPKAFVNGMPDGFGKMQWNGELILTKNFLVPYVQDDGTIKQDTNSWGEFVKFQAHATYGCFPRQPRNVIPIIFRRARGVITPGNPGLVTTS